MKPADLRGKHCQGLVNRRAFLVLEALLVSFPSQTPAARYTLETARWPQHPRSPPFRRHKLRMHGTSQRLGLHSAADGRSSTKILPSIMSGTSDVTSWIQLIPHRCVQHGRTWIRNTNQNMTIFSWRQNLVSGVKLVPP